MEVRVTDTTSADQRSANVFFKALLSMWDLQDVAALDAFARNGQLTVPNYADVVRELELWELGEEHREALERFSPDCVRIGCSYSHLVTAIEEGRKYGLLVIDTPQGIHADVYGNEHVEHFDFLRDSTAILADEAVVVLYVNKHPYNRDEVGEHGYDQYKEYDFDKWMSARREYYGSTVITEGQAINQYTSALSLQGFKVTEVLAVPCYSDVPDRAPYAFRLALKVARK